MKITTIQAAVGSALAFSTQAVATLHHRHQHLHHHQKLSHSHDSASLVSSYNERYSARNTTELRKRGGKTCEFPSDKGLVAVTPGEMNGGWAMAPDQECTSGTWCPIACPPGKVMNQWKPDTSYAFPESTVSINLGWWRGSLLTSNSTEDFTAMMMARWSNHSVTNPAV